LSKFDVFAQKFRELNNFNGVVWVVSGLNTSAVHRLKLTWEQLDAESSSAFGALDYLVSHQGTDFFFFAKISCYIHLFQGVLRIIARHCERLFSPHFPTSAYT
jgi:hypothetical protein